MAKLVVGLWLALAVLAGGRAEAATAPAGDPEARVWLAQSPLEGISVASEISHLLEMDINHLMALAAGVVVGGAVIAPYLGLDEFLGMIIGGVIGEWWYRERMWPFKRHWF